MMTLPGFGSCQCGSCSYMVTTQPYVAYTCHCRECQRLTASAFATCIQVPAEAIIVRSGNPQGRERVTDSGNTLSTWFCPICGSALFSQNSARPRIRTVYVGTLDNPHEVTVSAHIWTKRKLPWVPLPASHRRYEAAGNWTQDYANDIKRYRPDKVDT